MDCSLHDFRDDGGNIISDDNICAYIYVGTCVIDNDQMRAVIECLDGQTSDRQYFQRRTGNQHEVTLLGRTLRLLPCRLRQLFPEQYHIWFQDSIAICAQGDRSVFDKECSK